MVETGTVPVAASVVDPATGSLVEAEVDPAVVTPAVVVSAASLLDPATGAVETDLSWQNPLTGVVVLSTGVTGVVLLLPVWVVLEKSPVPLYHWHFLTQSASSPILVHPLKISISIVISAGAQKSWAGTSSLAEDQAHLVVSHESASVAGKQITESCSQLSVVIGWQNFLEKRGPFKST